MSCLEELFSVILRKLMPLGKYYRKRPLPFSLAPSYRGGKCCLQKYAHRSARSSSLPAISEPLSRVKVFRKPGGISQKRRTRSSPESVFLWPCPWRYRPDPPPSPQSGFCRRQTTVAEICQYARKTIVCRGQNCVATCGHRRRAGRLSAP